MDDICEQTSWFDWVVRPEDRRYLFIGICNMEMRVIWKDSISPNVTSNKGNSTSINTTLVCPFMEIEHW